MHFLSLLLLISLISSYNCHKGKDKDKDSNKRHTLIIVDDIKKIQESHSMLFDILSNTNGQQLTYKSYKDIDLSISKYGEYVYDNLIIIAPTLIKFIEPTRHINSRNVGGISVSQIEEYIDKGGNLLLLLPDVGNTQTDLLEISNICNISASEEEVIDPTSSRVVNLNGIKSNAITTQQSLHSLGNSVNDIINNNNNNNNNILSILYHGRVLTPSKGNILLNTILHSSPYSYKDRSYRIKHNKNLPLYNIDNESVTLQTSPVHPLIVGLQGRNSSRCVVVGSTSVLSNDAIKLSSDNYILTKSILLWSTYMRGGIKITNLTHRISGSIYGTPPPHQYTSSDYVTLEFDLHEYRDGIWIPFVSNDVQLKLVKVDPYIVKFVPPSYTDNKNIKSSHYIDIFQLPDIGGVYKLIIEHKRVGYNHIYEFIEIPVRIFKHSDYPRYLIASVPYYLACLVSMFGVLVISWFILFHEDQSHCLHSCAAPTVSESIEQTDKVVDIQTN
eukprot:GHVR01055379.1.p1 GENE.GHVR01055379.1~~GHVR01055379.1.p1  ORF type:complete len:500 (+),score=114.39 GHVR01055379.1:49-1548(+)